ncbi:MAG: Lrp/AsnC family transcriptional regulator [Lentisphaeria bacterium]|jgi:DNA-binding Lrp family transcriptional regulator|nr:Lrp/AsnC family transcriptional regulator [Lentisphaeria bacterium]
MDRKKLLRLLLENGRMSARDIAEKLGVKESEAAAEIQAMEEEKTIIGYHAVFDESLLPEHAVKAIIEVKVRPERDGGFDKIAQRLSKFSQVSNLYLMSGGFDLLVEVQGKNLNEVASFVARKLATQDGVLSTATHFLLKKYKEAGKLMREEERSERLNISI